MRSSHSIRLSDIAQRLRSDFRLALMVLFGVLTVLGVTPFTVYRFAQGEVLAGMVDVAIQVGISATVLYAWFGPSVRRAGAALVIFGTFGCIAAAYLTGPMGFLWLYPVLVANFVLASRRIAAAASLVSLAALAGHPTLVDGNQLATMAVTALVVCLFAYLFAHHNDVQHRKLEGLAARDPLTGALNRLTMEPELQRVIDAAGQAGPAGLLVLDLDGFKQVNDERGHEAGDVVLRRVAERIRGLIRQHDRLFRLGGDEFAVLLPGADVDALARVGQSICEAVAEQARIDGHNVTVSVGATVLRPGEQLGEWMNRADQAMYEAKHGGSNRVVVGPGIPA